MRPVRRVLARLIVWSLIAPCTTAVLGAVLQEGAPEPPPTPIEQALMEHVCSVVPAGSGAPESDRYLACLRTQLLMLRSDFGRDLGRLSAAERKALDSACNGVRTASGRDAYLDCIGARLAALRSRRSRGNPTPPPQIAPPTPEEVPAASTTAPQSQASSGSGLLIGAIALVAVFAGGGVLFFLKTRPVSHNCRVCGSQVPAAGDLCQTCRHEAAEAVRRAAAERAEQQRAQEEDQRRQKALEAQEAEDRRLKAHQEEEARRLQQQQHQEEEARKRADAERRRQEEDARARRTAADVPDGEFDPYAVLELPPGATRDDIHAAYAEARAKCDPALVSHLGYEVREHFEAKLQAIERAFQMLTE